MIMIENLEPKDVITLAISAVAFIFSVAASVIGFLRKRNEEKRHVSDQIHTLVTRLLELTTENAKDWASAQQEVALAMRTNYAQGNANALNEFNVTAQPRSQQAVAIARRALELIKTTHPRITDVEYLVIARALAPLRDPNADEMFEKSIATAPSETYKIANYRDYAINLFSAGFVEEARGIFRKTLDYIGTMENSLVGSHPGRKIRGKPRFDLFDPDLLCWQRGTTHQLWGFQEYQRHFVEEARKEVALARKAYEEIRNDWMRGQALWQLMPVEQQISQPAQAGGFANFGAQQAVQG